MVKQWKQWQTILLGSKITADCDCSHENKRRLLLGRKTMTKLDSILKKQRHYFTNKVDIDKAMVFPVVMYRCESWTIKNVECWRSDAFELWCWKDSWEYLGLQWDQSSQSQKKLSLNIHWKDCCWSWNPVLWPLDVKNWLNRKDPDSGKDWRQEKKDRGWDGWMASPTWWTWFWVSSKSWWWAGKPGVLQAWGHKESDTTEWLNWTKKCN